MFNRGRYGKNGYRDFRDHAAVSEQRLDKFIHKIAKLSLKDDRYLAFLEILLEEKEKRKTNTSLLEKAQAICKNAKTEIKKDDQALEMQYF